MLLILYMEYLERVRQPPGMMHMKLSYKDWLDVVTAYAEEEGESIEMVCAPPGWQLGLEPKPERGI